MIDCHTHCGTKEHWGAFAQEQSLVIAPEARQVVLDVRVDEFDRAMSDVDVAVVVAFHSPLLGAIVPNEYVAEFVSRAPSRLLGFACVDVMAEGVVQELEYCVKDLGLRGLKISPVYQAFDPTDRNLYSLYRALVRLDIPTLWHVGTTVSADAPLSHANPVLLDAVAREFPSLRMIIAHCGHPWLGETMALLRKHRNLAADLSSIHLRPWQSYQALLLAQEYGVLSSLLFGSDYPFFSPAETLEGLQSLNMMLEGSRLPRIEEAALENALDANPRRFLRL